MDLNTMSMVINFGVPLALLVATYFIGTLLERRHFADLRRREQLMRGFPVSTFEPLPDGWHASDPNLLVGNVVVSLDYFKRVIAGLRALFGGRIRTYEPLLDRARREAVLRVTEQAKAAGYDAVINLRLETSRMANSQSGEGVAGIEMLAFGTAIRLGDRFTRR